jgi:hypothetical protein
MVKITETAGTIQVFTMSNGDTLRIPARTSVEKDDFLVDTEEIRIAQKMNLIQVTSCNAEVPKEVVETAKVSAKSLKKGNKSGGAN